MQSESFADLSFQGGGEPSKSRATAGGDSSRSRRRSVDESSLSLRDGPSISVVTLPRTTEKTIYLSFYLSIYLSFYLSIFLIYLSLSLSRNILMPGFYFSIFYRVTIVIIAVAKFFAYTVEAGRNNHHGFELQRGGI